MHSDLNERGAFAHRPPAPWQRSRGLRSVISHWQSASGLGSPWVHEHELPARAARTEPLPEALHPSVANALAEDGIQRLYAHQSEAYRLVRDGHDVVVATPTASGKSLCYNLPILDTLAHDPRACALYLFPTKALSRDQEQVVRRFLGQAGLSTGAVTYDGDTPADARRAARERSPIVLTNPDMLHAGLLPHHTGWARLWSNLQYVVIDELHSYRGVFGSHLANVIRRLRRIAAFHGSSPRFIFCSATIGNAQPHASRILGRDVHLVDESGAPTGKRRVMVYNPPVLNPELGIRRSYLKCAVELAADLIQAEVPTLVFGQSRNGVEVMLKYLRDRLRQRGLDPAQIHGYRGGYLPATRRKVEEDLRTGRLRGVVATNALELGIDVGMLEAVVCAGYPGSVAALWQRFGRGGRRQGESLALLVTSSLPVDQYVATAPQYLVEAPVEQARIDPDNLEILLQHLKCAAFELPFVGGPTFGDVPEDALREMLDHLAQRGLLHAEQEGGGGWHWADDAYPANHVSLRSVSGDNFVIIDRSGDSVLAEMDWRSTHTMLHEQAIYQHDGAQYQVERLDFENHKAYVRRVKPDYYTTALTRTSVRVLEQSDVDPVVAVNGAQTQACHGDISVLETVVGYKKIKFHTHENVGYGDVHLPQMQMHTTAFWWSFSEDYVRRQSLPKPIFIDGLRGLLNAMHTVASVGLMIDPRDLGTALEEDFEDQMGSDRAASLFRPTLFLFDRVPGGIGLAPRIFVECQTLLRRTYQLVSGCSCEGGCPACIGPPIGVDGSGPSRRRVVLDLLTSVGVGATH